MLLRRSRSSTDGKTGTPEAAAPETSGETPPGGGETGGSPAGQQKRFVRPPLPGQASASPDRESAGHEHEEELSPLQRALSDEMISDALGDGTIGEETGDVAGELLGQAEGDGDEEVEAMLQEAIRRETAGADTGDGEGTDARSSWQSVPPPSVSRSSSPAARSSPESVMAEAPPRISRRSAGGKEEATGGRDEDAGSTLVVGRAINLVGSDINSCDVLRIEGNVQQAVVSECRVLEILGNGIFDGQAEVDYADIQGRYQGDLVVHGCLRIRGTGAVSGNVVYGEMIIERGGVIRGQFALGEDTGGEEGNDD